jgi:integrase/recombinase XerD
MLLADPAGRNDAPGRECEGRPEDRLGHEYAHGMVAQGPMPEVRSDLLAGIDYVDSMPTVAFCPMLALTTRKNTEAQMFKLRSADGGATILVTDMDGNAVDPICRFVGYLGAKAYSPNTALAYARDLIHLWTFLSTQGIHWTSFSPELSAAFLEYLRSVNANRKRRDTSIRLVVSEGAAVRPGLSAATINRILVAVDAFYRWAIFTGVFSGPNPIVRRQDRTSWRVSDRHKPFLAGIMRHKPEIRELRLKTVQRLPRPMSQYQVESLLAATRNLRDRSLILLMLNGGLRPGEVLGLQLKDIGYGRRRIFVRCRDDHPKGARSKSRVERVVDLHDGETLETLNTYVMHERPHDAEAPFVFLVGGGGANRRDPLSYSALARLFARACDRAGIREQWMTPHALRHTHATRMWEAGMRELTLQKRLGHASPESTRIYTRVSDAVVVTEYRQALGLDRPALGEGGNQP